MTFLVTLDGIGLDMGTENWLFLAVFGLPPIPLVDWRDAHGAAVGTFADGVVCVRDWAWLAT